MPEDEEDERELDGCDLDFSVDPTPDEELPKPEDDQ